MAADELCLYHVPSLCWVDGVPRERVQSTDEVLDVGDEQVMEL
jgi:hypothetical protein